MPKEITIEEGEISINDSLLPQEVYTKNAGFKIPFDPCSCERVNKEERATTYKKDPRAPRGIFVSILLNSGE